MEDNYKELFDYKKLLIFGVEGSGKTSLSERLERGCFTNESHSYERKI